MDGEQLTPGWISFRGIAEFDNESQVKDSMAELTDLGSVAKFTSQIIDVESDEPMLAFSYRTEEGRNMITLQSITHSDARDSEPSDQQDDERFLGVSANFNYNYLETFERTLNTILEVTEVLEVTNLDILYSLEMEFESLANIQEIDEITDHQIVGVQFKHQDYSYSFRQEQEETFVSATKDEETTINDSTNGSFLSEQVEIVTPFIEEICHG